MSSPLEILHKSIVLPSNAEAKYSPFGKNATLVKQEEWA